MLMNCRSYDGKAVEFKFRKGIVQANIARHMNSVFISEVIC